MKKHPLMIGVVAYLVLFCGCTEQREDLTQKTQKADFYAEQGLENIQEAVELYQALIETVTDERKRGSLKLKLGNLYFATGHYADAIECFQAIDSQEAKKKLAITYFKDAQYTNARALFEQLGRLPDAEYLYYYAQASEKAYLYDTAISLYRDIDHISPFYRKAQERIEAINLSEEVLSKKQIEAVLTSAPRQEEYPDAGALILLSDETLEVFADNTSTYDVHFMVKIFNERGKNKFSEIQIGYDSTFEQVELEYARTIKPDGTVVYVGDKNIRDVSRYLNFPLYSNVRVRIVSMPEVAEGVIIEYRAKMIRKKMINKKDFVTHYSVQDSEPIREANFSVIVPRDRDFHHMTINEDYNTFGVSLEPQESMRDNKKVFRWHMEHIPEIMPEPAMSPYSRINPIIMISSFSEWEEVYHWWYDVYRDKISIDEDIRKKIHELINDKSSVPDKIRALYNFCEQDIRYVAVAYGDAGYVPHRATDIFKNKYGDCKDQAVLLIAMLRSVGIQAYPVLIGTYDHIDLQQAFPALPFDHCITVVQIDDEWFFMDPTGETVSFGDLPAMDQNRSVFVILDDGHTILSTPLFEASHNISQINNTITVNADETIAIKRSVSTSGVFAQGQRNWLRSTKPRLIEETLRGAANAVAPGAQLKRYTVDNQDDLDKEIILEYEFEAPEFLTKAGNFRLLPQLGGIDISSVAREERRYPIEQPILKETSTATEIEFPKQLSILYLPENIAFDCEWFTYENTYSTTDRAISFYAKFTMKKNIVSQQEYKAYKELVETISREAKQRIILQEIQ